MAAPDGNLPIQELTSSEPRSAYRAAIVRAHREVEPCIVALNALMDRDGNPDAAEVSTTRLRLARANLKRTEIAQKACTHLVADTRDEEAEVLCDLRQRETEHFQMISQHIGR